MGIRGQVLILLGARAALLAVYLTVMNIQSRTSPMILMVLIISGFLEIIANTSFFKSKIIEKPRKENQDKSEKPAEKPKLEELVIEEDTKGKEE